MDERRVAVRHESSQATPCHYATPERVDCEWADVQNVSRTGVALRMKRPFEVGAQVIIELPARTYQAIHPVSANVIRVTQQPDGQWLVACSFQKPLDDDEVEKLV